ncbi:hypothetical protein MBM_02628 [Drepanopeziza brunnea f. sp. 'multigermtubi' MB_m1]|uniref:Uncharacterized protein n=1 Tax=Marssonina brunnea f. sp. multigermtubi (strain MB_m1) TaxID=1072389 RepID=K1X2D1_MARBU|nr:uncharacterized protein MBM_02628 [Drepanopeziza brunnea f. sp. 'multigermtubi' MB_m1]EKD19391.1 hypothetical protein MBM_02628 [Drepanopeziza brunnea f. sp. 'multigermtubi' MB_m1]
MHTTIFSLPLGLLLLTSSTTLAIPIQSSPSMLDTYLDFNGPPLQPAAALIQRSSPLSNQPPYPLPLQKRTLDRRQKGSNSNNQLHSDLAAPVPNLQKQRKRELIQAQKPLTESQAQAQKPLTQRPGPETPADAKPQTHQHKNPHPDPNGPHHHHHHHHLPHHHHHPHHNPGSPSTYPHGIRFPYSTLSPSTPQCPSRCQLRTTLLAVSETELSKAKGGDDDDDDTKSQIRIQPRSRPRAHAHLERRAHALTKALLHRLLADGDASSASSASASASASYGSLAEGGSTTTTTNTTAGTTTAIEPLLLAGSKKEAASER